MPDRINVGVDLHKTQFTICVLIDDEVVETGTVYRMGNEGFLEFTARMQAVSAENGNCEVRIAIESTANSRFFKEVMEKAGFRVTVVNTLRFKVINLSTKKTDKNDARTLAEFLSRDILPQSHLCSAGSEGLRRILKSRSLLVEDAVALKNQAHAVLLAYGHITATAQFQSKAGRARLLEAVSPAEAAIVSIIFETLEAVEKQRKILEKRLREITADDRNVNLLMTIPGIGIVNACTISAYTDDINRFETYKNYSAYCGLVPWVQTSNETVYYGKITKRGPQELRTALVQCVVAMVRMEEKTGNLDIMRQYQELKEQKSSGKAIIATARKLSRIIYMMLKTGKPFDDRRLTR
ncbi:MAG: IS110 family transposase, partial [Spirochaetales bacterium]|nr:IS110 family transposase [Spirochaetales bacterium]